MGDGEQQGGRGFQPDSDVHITLEDQQKINNFARYYAKLGDIKTVLKTKQSELKDLEDATEELELLDDDTKIPLLQGEVFICMNVLDTNKALEKEKKRIEIEIADMEDALEDLKNILSNLKTLLYAKFGNHINLED